MAVSALGGVGGSGNPAPAGATIGCRGGRTKMSIRTETHPHIDAVRHHHQAVTRQRMVLDERLAIALHEMPIDDLRRLRETLHALPREGMASEALIAKTVEGQSKDA